jgi:hypothetical protein
MKLLKRRNNVSNFFPYICVGKRFIIMNYTNYKEEKSKHSPAVTREIGLTFLRVIRKDRLPAAGFFY